LRGENRGVFFVRTNVHGHGGFSNVLDHHVRRFNGNLFAEAHALPLATTSSSCVRRDKLERSI
jgi:hypothetical protein